jgi:hypothetical protein
MVEKVITPAPNVVDFARYQAGRGAAKNTLRKETLRMSRMCRHCGAALADGEREEECSSAFNVEISPRKFYAD